jgi:hypothetical protein
MRGSDAIEAALALYRQPSLVRQVQKSPLPSGMTEVLRIAAGSKEEATAPAAELGTEGLELFSACQFFLQTMLFYHDVDDFRVLGLKRDATPAQLKDHKRLVLKWLHPDRNRNSWENKLFNRAMDAGTRLEAALAENDVKVIVPTRESRSRSHVRRERWQATQRQHRKNYVWQATFLTFKRKFVLAMLVIGLGGLVVFSSDHGSHYPLMFDEASN